MTKEQFLNGVSFKLPNQLLRGTSTYVFDGEKILQEFRRENGGLLFKDHEANIDKIGKVKFTAYTFVMDKRVEVEFRFEDLEVFEELVEAI